uniref:RNB domain-containing protein n=1 Tax=Chromera velia CCMP2878 TaxID=1169474 RepID=A0A0G4HM27_9ALVE|eukprot:Cvel_7435.t1-p1 / transcript=Cvel_7435.t1 / gene=Cvel_7435 / organism=Chromera_velia_CCMP2878 / gene_product=hypothetical protein / transcript_product=hypothetical protein / location=Cvel_scaffold388:68566-76650(-) / protein_length=1346 / sequence_SO=supercontig / SO=protein_coding / is_pseudo=false
MLSRVRIVLALCICCTRLKQNAAFIPLGRDGNVNRERQRTYRRGDWSGSPRFSVSEKARFVFEDSRDSEETGRRPPDGDGPRQRQRRDAPPQSAFQQRAGAGSARHRDGGHVGTRGGDRGRDASPTTPLPRWQRRAMAKEPVHSELSVTRLYLQPGWSPPGQKRGLKLSTRGSEGKKGRGQIQRDVLSSLREVLLRGATQFRSEWGQAELGTGRDVFVEEGSKKEDPEVAVQEGSLVLCRHPQMRTCLVFGRVVSLCPAGMSDGKIWSRTAESDRLSVEPFVVFPLEREEEGTEKAIRQEEIMKDGKRMQIRVDRDTKTLSLLDALPSHCLAEWANKVGGEVKKKEPTGMQSLSSLPVSFTVSWKDACHPQLNLPSSSSPSRGSTSEEGGGGERSKEGGEDGEDAVETLDFAEVARLLCSFMDLPVCYASPPPEVKAEEKGNKTQRREMVPVSASSHSLTRAFSPRDAFGPTWLDRLREWRRGKRRKVTDRKMRSVGPDEVALFGLQSELLQDAVRREARAAEESKKKKGENGNDQSENRGNIDLELLLALRLAACLGMMTNKALIQPPAPTAVMERNRETEADTETGEGADKHTMRVSSLAWVFKETHNVQREHFREFLATAQEALGSLPASSSSQGQAEKAEAGGTVSKRERDEEEAFSTSPAEAEGENGDAEKEEKETREHVARLCAPGPSRFVEALRIFAAEQRRAETSAWKKPNKERAEERAAPPKMAEQVLKALDRPVSPEGAETLLKDLGLLCLSSEEMGETGKDREVSMEETASAVTRAETFFITGVSRRAALEGCVSGGGDGDGLCFWVRASSPHEASAEREDEHEERVEYLAHEPGRKLIGGADLPVGLRSSKQTQGRKEGKQAGKDDWTLRVPLRDCRGLRLLSIDPSETHTRDDGFALDPVRRELLIAIADVDRLVQRGSSLDRVARENRKSKWGSSEGVSHMLPYSVRQAAALSSFRENLCVAVSIPIREDAELPSRDQGMQFLEALDVSKAEVGFALFGRTTPVAQQKVGFLLRHFLEKGGEGAWEGFETYGDGSTAEDEDRDIRLLAAAAGCFDGCNRGGLDGSSWKTGGSEEGEFSADKEKKENLEGEGSLGEIVNEQSGLEGESDTEIGFSLTGRLLRLFSLASASFLEAQGAATILPEAEVSEIIEGVKGGVGSYGRDGKVKRFATKPLRSYLALAQQRQLKKAIFSKLFNEQIFHPVGSDAQEEEETDGATEGGRETGEGEQEDEEQKTYLFREKRPAAENSSLSDTNEQKETAASSRRAPSLLFAAKSFKRPIRADRKSSREGGRQSEQTRGKRDMKKSISKKGKGYERKQEDFVLPKEFNPLQKS